MIIAGTGHRPKDLPCLYDEAHDFYFLVKEEIRSFLENNDVACVISGMALGYDTWLAEVALQLDIPLHVYAPCANQSARWPYESRTRYAGILNKAMYYIEISPVYTSTCMQERNIKMTNDCDKLLALWNPAKKYGGTWNCIQYAESVNKPIINIWPEETV